MCLQNSISKFTNKKELLQRLLKENTINSFSHLGLFKYLLIVIIFCFLGIIL